MSAYSIATRGLAGRKIPQGVLAAINTLLFGASEQGAWYDPSDLPTLFQDTAGTTPVTAVEQAVALMLDKSGRGNHASQATSTKRPKYSRRVNLLTKTEQFSDAVWSKFTNGTGIAPVVTDAFGTAPDGTQTAARLQLSVGAGTTSVDVSYVTQAVANAAQSLGRIWVKLNSGANKNFSLRVGGTIAHSNLATSEWQEFSISDATGNRLDVSLYGHTSGGSIDLLVWHPSLTLATDAHLPYQRVNTATDYDADPAKFPAYLRFDGVDDALQTGSIDFTGTDKMTVWAGVTKLSDAATAILMGLGSGAVAGSVFLQAPFGAASPSYLFQSTGSTQRWAASTAYPSPSTAVLTGISDISGDHVSLRVNASVVATTTTDQGTGNYGNYPLYIGGQGGTAYYFNGRLYNLIVRGAATPLPQIEAVETIIRQKMRLP